MTSDRIVIVGAGLGGLRTAERLRRLGHEGPVTLVGEEPGVAYDRPPLSKSLLTQDEEPAPVALRAEEKYADLDLDLRLGVRVEAVDATGRTLRLSNGTSLVWSRLVVATGSRARTVPAWDHFANVHTLRTFDDCVRLRAGIRSAQHVTVVGGGVLGCEIASAARALGIEVSLVEGLAQPLARVLGPSLGATVADLHRDRGVDLHLGTPVDRIEGGTSAEKVVLSDGTVIDTDLVVVAIGSVAATDWLDGSGIPVDDGVVCDATGASGVEGVYAVGDAARMPHPGAAEPMRLEHWTSAGDTAALVATNLLASPGEQKSVSEVPYVWSDQHGVKIQVLGLPSADAEVLVVAGDPGEHAFLALLARDGVVVGAVAMAMPAPLMRCRALVVGAIPLEDALEQHPWERTKPTA